MILPAVSPSPVIHPSANPFLLSWPFLLLFDLQISKGCLCNHGFGTILWDLVDPHSIHKWKWLWALTKNPLVLSSWAWKGSGQGQFFEDPVGVLSSLCVATRMCHIFSSRSLALGVTRMNDRACIVFEASGTSVTNTSYRSIPHLVVGCFPVDPLILGTALSILISSFPFNFLKNILNWITR